MMMIATSGRTTGLAIEIAQNEFSLPVVIFLWILGIAAAWVVIGGTVGLVVGRVIRNRDRQVAKEALQDLREYEETGTVSRPPVLDVPQRKEEAS